MTTSDPAHSPAPFAAQRSYGQGSVLAAWLVSTEITPLQIGRHWISTRQATSNSSTSAQPASATASRSGVQ